MVKLASKPKVNGAELTRLYDDFRGKLKRWLRCFKTANTLDDPRTNGYLAETGDAFDLAYAALLEAAGSNGKTTCIVVLPDGRHLVGIIDEHDYIGDDWTFLQCVEPANIVTLR